MSKLPHSSLCAYSTRSTVALCLFLLPIRRVGGKGTLPLILCCVGCVLQVHLKERSATITMHILLSLRDSYRWNRLCSSCGVARSVSARVRSAGMRECPRPASLVPSPPAPSVHPSTPTTTPQGTLYLEAGRSVATTPDSLSWLCDLREPSCINSHKPP